MGQEETFSTGADATIKAVLIVMSGIPLILSGSTRSNQLVQEIMSGQLTQLVVESSGSKCHLRLLHVPYLHPVLRAL